MAIISLFSYSIFRDFPDFPTISGPDYGASRISPQSLTLYDALYLFSKGFSTIIPKIPAHAGNYFIYHKDCFEMGFVKLGQGYWGAQTKIRRGKTGGRGRLFSVGGPSGGPPPIRGEDGEPWRATLPRKGRVPVSAGREIIPAGGFLLALNSPLQYIIRLAKNSPGRRGRVGGGFFDGSGAASPLAESGALRAGYGKLRPLGKTLRISYFLVV